MSAYFGSHRPLIEVFCGDLKTKIISDLLQKYRQLTQERLAVFQPGFTSWTEGDNQEEEPPGHHRAGQMGTPGVAQVTETSPPPVPGPANGHLSQSHNSGRSRCQGCDEICMKQGCLAAAGPVLINDSIRRCRRCYPTRNTFIIHYLLMQSILCILIPPPATAH